MEQREPNVGGWSWQITGAISDSLRGIFFQKNAKIANKFSGLANSGGHNSAMITNA